MDNNVLYSEIVDPLFSYHKLNEAGMRKASEVAYSFTSLLSTLSLLCTPGREFAIVKTKLEEASFFAKKAVANDPANQA